MNGSTAACCATKDDIGDTQSLRQQIAERDHPRCKCLVAHRLAVLVFSSFESGFLNLDQSSHIHGQGNAVFSSAAPLADPALNTA